MKGRAMNAMDESLRLLVEKRFGQIPVRLARSARMPSSQRRYAYVESTRAVRPLGIYFFSAIRQHLLSGPAHRSACRCACAATVRAERQVILCRRRYSRVSAPVVRDGCQAHKLDLHRGKKVSRQGGSHAIFQARTRRLSRRDTQDRDRPTAQPPGGKDRAFRTETRQAHLRQRRCPTEQPGRKQP